MRTTLLRLLRANLGFPIAAGLVGLSAAGLLADIARWAHGQPHPLMGIFVAATAMCGLALILAQRRLIRSFRYRVSVSGSPNHSAAAPPARDDTGTRQGTRPRGAP